MLKEILSSNCKNKIQSKTLVKEIVKRESCSNIFLHLPPKFSKKVFFRAFINDCFTVPYHDQCTQENGKKEIYHFQAISGYDNRLHYYNLVVPFCKQFKTKLDEFPFLLNLFAQFAVQSSGENLQTIKFYRSIHSIYYVLVYVISMILFQSYFTRLD